MKFQRSSFRPPSGFIFINKPERITSHDIVERLRQITGIQKIGHSGTLDPFATGLLICGIGREATKRLSIFLKKPKEYEAEIILGAVSETYDREGKITALEGVERPSKEEIEKALKRFVGKIMQTPPVFSAKKQKGRKLYELARRGEAVSPKPVQVQVYDISLLSYRWPLLRMKVKCSSGTYIRSLVHDIGEHLGCGGYLNRLCRTKIGEFSLEQAVELSRLNFGNWQRMMA